MEKQTISDGQLRDELIKLFESVDIMVDVNSDNYHLYKIKNPKEYYVYALYDNESNSIFYIGKGKNKRAWKHLKSSGVNAIKESYIQKIQRRGGQPEILILQDNLNENDALKLESYLIGRYSDYLTNIVVGTKINNLSTYEILCIKYGEENVKECEDEPREESPCEIMGIEDYIVYAKNIIKKGEKMLDCVYRYNGISYSFTNTIHLLN